MKRVLYYVPTFPSFSQNFITREIEALIKSGKVDVYLLALEQGKGGYIPNVLKGRLFYFGRRRYLRILDGFSYLISHPVKTTGLIIKYFDRLLSLGTAISMKSLIDSLKPDLIVANWITEGALIANMLSDLTKTPFGIECHAEDIWLSRMENLRKRIEDSKFVMTCTNYNSAFLKKVCGRHNWDKIHTIYHHIDSNLFGGRTTNFNEVPVIYLVGRMVEKKGFEYFIKAVRILRDRGLAFNVRIAGDPGTEKPKLIELSKRLGLAGIVNFINEVDFREHSHNYLESDIFVLPSIRSTDGNIDGIPNVMVEAMFAGLPVVASSISAIPEVVDDCQTGYLVNEKDEMMLADRIEDLINNKEARKDFGTRGREKALAMFNTLDQIEDLLLD